MSISAWPTRLRSFSAKRPGDAVLALIGRDLKLALRGSGGALTGLLFFLLVVAVVPFALGPDLPLLGRLGPGILWIAALLASLLGLDRLWAIDRADGSLDVLAGAATPLPLVALAKIVAHWLATGLPIVLATPLVGLLANLRPGESLAAALALLIGTPALAALGAAAAAAAVALPRGGLLVPVLVLPLAVPTLIFGTAAAQAARTGPGDALAPFAFLGAITLLSLVAAPVAAAAALRADLE